MIGLDTNVLVRYLAQDDPSQARKVDVFLSEAMESGSRLHIDDIVLCETVWVLSGLSGGEGFDRGRARQNHEHLPLLFR